MPVRMAVLALMVILAACTNGGEATGVPTQILIPATATVTPEIPTITPMLPPPPVAAALPTDIPDNLAALENELERQLALLVMADLAGAQQIPAETISAAAVTEIYRYGEAVDCAQVEDAHLGDEFPGFQIVLTANAIVYEYHTDATGATIRLCRQMPVTEARGELLVLVDPIAGEMVALAQRRLGEQLDLPMRRIRMADIQAFTWPDSSLGCPVEDQEYTQMNIDGYRLVMTVGNNEYIFHTDFDRLMHCDPGNEVLPTAPAPD